MNSGYDQIPHEAKLTEGPVGKTLTRLTFPMVFGFVSLFLFGFVDTFFVAQLGTKELAAISFTFPISFFVISISIGLGVGTSSVVSRAIGEGDMQKMRHLSTYSLILAFAIVFACAMIGLLMIRPLLYWMGAPEDIRQLSEDYLSIWFWGVGVFAIPMVGNNALRAAGHAKIPSLIMMFSTAINCILDPLLIFGLCGFPRMEIKGAALATVIAWVVTLFVCIWVLIRREKMLDLTLPKVAHVLRSWKAVLYIAVPSMMNNVLVPITAGVVTAMLAAFGPEAVAAFGVGSRLEPLALLVIIALSSVLVPFVGQNMGAGKYDRIKQGLRLSLLFTLLWEGAVFVVIAFAAYPVAKLFSGDAAVVDKIVAYFWIVPPSYGFQGVSFLISSAFYGINKPFRATALNLLRLFGLTIPLAYAGSFLFGVKGIFMGASLGNVFSAVFAYFWMRKTFNDRLQKLS